ncbi:CBS domain-containing protein [Meiothermus cerbereus]|jgi:CBS domain-containing protein|uniref:CBS domain-containing protein n=1 Tax=Meiothermus cerbereus TaxID=65552 RepID=UPI000484E298|nr:CBS domain-containing protein [Meiothermus cerbereus]
MKAKEIMVKPIVAVSPKTPLTEVAQQMLKHRIGSVVVVDEKGQLAGIITQGDFCRHPGRMVPFSLFESANVLANWLYPEQVERVYKAARNLRAQDIMRAPVVTVSPEASLERILALMLRHDINRIPVVRRGKVVGIISRYDLLKVLQQELAS